MLYHYLAHAWASSYIAMAAHDSLEEETDKRIPVPPSISSHAYAFPRVC